MRPHLASLTLRGFKTVKEPAKFELGQLAVLIGPNGVGKTNLISLLSYAVVGLDTSRQPPNLCRPPARYTERYTALHGDFKGAEPLWLVL